MTFDSLSILRHLQAMEHQLAEVPQHVRALRTACTGGDRQAAQCAAAQAERHVRTMAITVEHLKAHVMLADGLGATLESLSELVLRAARLVVLAELDTLRELVRDPRPLSWGRFWGIEDLTACVHAELGQITNQWRAHRGRARTERPAYRAALQAAHAAMCKLGTASEFAHFLWEGHRRTDWPALRALCTRISAALTLRLDIDPDRPLVVYRQPGTGRATEWS